MTWYSFDQWAHAFVALDHQTIVEMSLHIMLDYLNICVFETLNMSYLHFFDRFYYDRLRAFSLFECRKCEKLFQAIFHKGSFCQQNCFIHPTVWRWFITKVLDFFCQWSSSTVFVNIFRKLNLVHHAGRRTRLWTVCV